MRFLTTLLRTAAIIAIVLTWRSREVSAETCGDWGARYCTACMDSGGPGWYFLQYTCVSGQLQNQQQYGYYGSEVNCISAQATSCDYVGGVSP